MPPKKKDGEVKKKKGARPPWMTEEMYDLSQNLPKLQEFWSGDIKESKGKATDKPIPNISRTEAGLFILQLLFPSHKAAKEQREASIKLGVVETSVKVLASQKPQDMVSAAHLLAVMADTFDQSRQIMMDTKPAVIPQLLAGLSTQDSAPLKAAICGLLRVISKHDDTRPRLWRQLRDWDWSHLIGCLRMQDLSQLGGRNAAHDAMAVLDAMCSAPEGDVGSQCCTHVVNSGGLQAIVKVLQDRVSHPMAKAGGVSVLNQIMKRAPSTVCEEVMIAGGGLRPVITMLSNPIIPLLFKAHAAAVLLRFIMPDSLWKNASMLPGGGPRPKTAIMAQLKSTGGTTAGAEGGGVMADAAAGQLEELGIAGSAPAEEQQAPVAAAVAGGTAGPAVGVSRVGTAAVGPRPGTTGSFLDPTLRDDALLDEATKADIAQRAKVVAEAGAVSPLIRLCVGPQGPLADLEAIVSPGEAGQTDDEKGVKSKSKKKKGGKKKKGKLEPGMGEVQTWSSAVLRMISLDAEQRQGIVSAGLVRYVLPLLESKIHPARWNARQTLVNLSMSAQFMPHLQLYKVPTYIHGSNIPSRHYERPFPSSGVVENDLQKIPAHLAGAVAAAQKDILSRGATGPAIMGSKPPALKNARTQPRVGIAATLAGTETAS